METEPIYGWRLFRTIGTAKLQGCWYNPWPDKNLTAKCIYKHYYVGILKSVPDVRPDKEKVAREHLSLGICSCGIYLTKEPDINHWHAAEIIAYCKGWGTIVEGERGMRCEHVEILNLYKIGGDRVHQVGLDASFELNPIYPYYYGLPVEECTFPIRHMRVENNIRYIDRMTI